MTAFWSAVLVPSTPRLMTMTSASLSAAYLTPFATVRSVPSPESFMTFTAMSRTWARPATPSPLSVTAPTTPATCVPWYVYVFSCQSPSSSYPFVLSSIGYQFSSTKLYP